MRAVRTTLLAVALVLVAASAWAQTSVAFYIVPKIGAGTMADPFRPKYIGDIAGAQWSAMDYGEEGTFLAGASLTPAQHAFVTDNADVVAIPALDTAVGGNPTLNRVRNYMESRSIPGTWIQTTTTWRGVLGRTGRVCLVMQRMFGIGRKVFGNSGNALETTLGASGLLDGFIAAGVSLNIQTSGLSTTTTIRQGLLVLADQLPLFGLAGETF
jgi:hypothetical protein